MSTNLTVCIVDDEAAVRKALQLMLSTAGYAVESFDSAADFLHRCDRDKVGCVVLDVRMPGMDGLTLLRQLRAEQVDFPVIMLSAHGDIQMAVGAVKAGAVDFVEKPAQADMLREKVAAALQLAQKWREEASERKEILRRYESLATREREVFELLTEGKSAALIAKILHKSENTVRVQRASIQRKMQAENVAELVKMKSVIVQQRSG